MLDWQVLPSGTVHCARTRVGKLAGLGNIVQESTTVDHTDLETAPTTALHGRHPALVFVCNFTASTLHVTLLLLSTHPQTC